MIWLIARRELVDIWRDGRTRAAGSAVVALLTATLVAGWVETSRLQTERAAARETMREQWLEQGSKNPHSAAHYGIYAVRPRTLLSLVDSGTDPYVGIATWLEAHKQNQSRYRPVRDTTVLGRSAQVTAALILQFVVPLLIVIVLAPVIAEEREHGTLALVVSSGVAHHTVAAGKMLGAMLALGCALAPAAVIGAAVGVATSVESTPDLAGRAAALALAYAAYFLVFVAVGLAASARGRTARAALMVLLLFWAVNIIMPRVMSDVARRVSPLPSTAEMQVAIDNARRMGIDGHNPEPNRLKALEAATLDEYRVPTLGALPVNFEGILLNEDERYGNQIYDREFGRLWSAMAAQERIHLAGAILGPLPALRALSHAFAGTDWNHQREFAEAAERYRRMMVEAMNDELTYRSISTSYGENVKGRETWTSVPDFVHTPPSLRQVMSSAWMSVAVLAGWVLVAVTAFLVTSRSLLVS
jgi:ABC-2 type transport system permease protein